MMRHCLLALCLLAGAGRAADTAGAYTEAPVDPALAIYDTQLFNLVDNRRSLSDGINHFQPPFAVEFNRLVSQAVVSARNQNGPPLKRRLMSGPAGDTRMFNDARGGKRYLYYEACQAHACDETRIELLYEPASNRMSARLLLRGQEQWLGNPVAGEKALLEHLKLAPGR